MSSGKKKSDAVSINRDDSSDESEDDEDKPKSTKKKSSKAPLANKRGFSMSHSCKLGLWLFVMFALVMSDVFIERVMSKTKLGLVNGRLPTTKGLCAQGLILVIALIIFDFLISHEKI